MNERDLTLVNQLRQAILNQQVIAGPTDTVFGLLAAATAAGAKALYQIKRRPEARFLPLVCNSVEMAQRYVMITPKQREMINHFSPGATTFVAKRRRGVLPGVNDDSATLAIRILPVAWINQLLDALDAPLLLTSANKHQEAPCRDDAACRAVFGAEVAVIVAGTSLTGQPSTIVDLTTNQILRAGATAPAIANYLKEEKQ